ncbi:hypothetical protein UFOVP116_127 [uncultured Caudovirales phage]|uniref:Uncharacterized protein n=1 Tax=uncultured Caudovirales phage TaxID=2100421 RepID=A0A6J5L6U1_9CAUD|nr:hypothetical protein UFOVP116_127 [uncultured Caudovirales phage]
MSKEFALMRDVITKYHPRFKRSKDLRNFGLSQPHIFNVTRLIEESLADIGDYEFIDAAHSDYSDGSDSKTASIRQQSRTETGNSFLGEIAAVSSAGGVLKEGALRCTIYNPHIDGLQFYYLPKSMWQNHVTIHPTSGIGKVLFSWHKPTQKIKLLDDYQCGSFIELACAK